MVRSRSRPLIYFLELFFCHNLFFYVYVCLIDWHGLFGLDFRSELYLICSLVVVRLGNSPIAAEKYENFIKSRKSPPCYGGSEGDFGKSSGAELTES